MKHKKILAMLSLAPAVLIAGIAVSTAAEIQSDQLQSEPQAHRINIRECTMPYEIGEPNSDA